MKKFALLLTLLFCMSPISYASDLPRIAVYVTGDVGDNEKTSLGTRMLAALVNSGRYRGIERSAAFLAELEREHETQRSGMIDDDQISALGRQFGVKYICVADITPAFGAFHVSARIINVETAEVVFIGDAHSSLETMDDLTEVSNDVVRKMFGIEEEVDLVGTIEPTWVSHLRQNNFWIGIGLEALGVGLITYGLIENNNVTNAKNRSGGEASARNRNIGYVLGSAFLLGGISIHILF